MNKPKPIYEFLLWNTCRNNCKFCHQKANKAKFPGKFPEGEEKLKPILLVKNFLATQSMTKGSHILFMGGELFDTPLAPDVEKEFLDLAEYTAKGMTENKYGFLYVNTNLIYSDLTLLFKYLDIFKKYDIENRVRFTTSFDFEYRFKTDFDRQLVLKNMKIIKKRYPKMSRMVNIILTNKAIDFFKSHNYLQYNEDFYKEYGFHIHLIPYITLKKEQAPERKDVLSFFLDNCKENLSFLERYAAEEMCDQKRYIYEYDGTSLKKASSGNSSCGHNENFRKVYKDSDACFVCDRQSMLNFLR